MVSGPTVRRQDSGECSVDSSLFYVEEKYLEPRTLVLYSGVGYEQNERMMSSYGYLPQVMIHVVRFCSANYSFILTAELLLRSRTFNLGT